MIKAVNVIKAINTLKVINASSSYKNEDAALNALSALSVSAWGEASAALA